MYQFGKKFNYALKQVLIQKKLETFDLSAINETFGTTFLLHQGGPRKPQ